MRENDFGVWLELSYRTPRDSTLDRKSRTSLISTIRRIERFAGELDSQWRQDRGRSLLASLEYTRRDAEYGQSVRHAVPIQGDALTGTASLRRAAAIYFEYCRARPPSVTPDQPVPE